MATDQQKLAMYEGMLRIRFFEERVAELFEKGEIPGFIHLSIGQEAVSVVMTAPLTKDDYLVTSHRPHGDVLAKGSSTKKVMAELYGKATGTNKGKGGTLHVADFSNGILGANGIVGGGLPLSTGLALSQKMTGKQAVTLCSFGDGASNQGTFHESLNLAAVWNLPVIFLLINNQYAGMTPTAKVTSVIPISKRAVSYSMPGKTVDGNNVLAVCDAVHEAVERAKEGKGPSLIECNTYRWMGHAQGEEIYEVEYRSDEEVEAWKKRCPIAAFEKVLLAEGLLSREKITAIREEVKQEIEDAVAFARESPLPAPEEALSDLFQV
ncbi:MAG: thiamine pyrophosphate-dependent dehydrogenase E1 component subunit alpha [Deltaproteobacteria bacterium]|nr:thiamine pyrophosphate-dependent dehydrogenase E1 component subunit alpha [Deltaproteobacteria bacterium]